MKTFHVLARMMLNRPSRSIGTKLFLIFFCFLGASIAGLGFFSFSIAKTAIVDQMLSGSLQSISVAGEKLDMKQQFYLDVSKQLMNNSSFTKHLFLMTNKGIGEEELRQRMLDIQKLFEQLLLSDDQIWDITLIPLEDDIPVIRTGRSEIEAEIADAAWVDATRNAAGQPVWLSVQDKGYLGNASKPLFGYGRLLGRGNVGSHDFILLVQMDAAVLRDIAASVMLSSGSETVIMARSGETIMGNAPESIMDFVHMPAEASDAGSYVDEGTNGTERLIAHRRSALNDWRIVAVAPLQELYSPVTTIREMTFIFIIVNTIAALLIGVWMAGMVGLPLTQMLALMRSAVDGNLSGRLVFKRHQDEMGQTAQAYNRMMEQISRLISNASATALEATESGRLMSEAANQTAQTAGDIHGASHEIARGARQLMVQAEAGTDRMGEMGVRVSELLTLQHQMSRSAVTVNEWCQQEKRTVHTLIDKTAESEAELHKVAERANILQESAHSVQSFLVRMADMARQTKVLALNASIEATRAGEAGAGFKVISDEVQHLANQTNALIGHANEVMRTIQTEVEGTVKALYAALPYFRDMAGEVYSVQHLFNGIEEQMEVLLSHSHEVVAAVDLLEKHQLLLNETMKEVTTVSRESAAATEQVASLCTAQFSIGEQLVGRSDRMLRISSRLEQHMSSFHIAK